MYGKIFASLYQGTLRGKPDEILVFTNMIACCDRYGEVDKHPKAIADETGLPIERVLAAIVVLESPDFESRSREHEGARITRCSTDRTWGWVIVNYVKYRSIRDEESRREQNLLAVRKHRNKLSSDVSHGKPSVINVSHGKPSVINVIPVSHGKPMQRQMQRQDAEEYDDDDEPHAHAHARTRTHAKEADPQSSSSSSSLETKTTTEDIFSEVESIIAKDKETLAKVMTTKKNWKDFRIHHGAIFIARSGEDGELTNWKELFDLQGYEKLSASYREILSNTETKKVFFSAMVADLEGINKVVEVAEVSSMRRETYQSPVDGGDE